MSDLSDSLQAFVSYVQTHLTGDEKGEAAEFLDHLFRALGHDGIKDAVALRQLRREVMARMNWSLRDLYRTLEDPGANPLRYAQVRLHTAVRAAYAMPKTGDILTFLLALNQSCAAKEAAGEKITPPGLPLPKEEYASFITEDCIKI